VAAKAGVAINAMAAIAVASFFMAAPKHAEIYHSVCGRLMPLQHSEFEFFC
jgi:hypothetical protein